ncbi:cation-transporting P-type ATPase [Burkholderiaceae bacterium FT117]|uniref:cation-translocating P-type ATPase n=1 Tax=Zeimonas sediminis TaxID=2944268 RepID=UPI002342F878|nr:cation-transporting P-type ATPase [Zeimonas sediminis]MCM5569215.1 cation-transporting P-type ATPase [Zeimonas sediminis]
MIRSAPVDRLQGLDGSGQGLSESDAAARASTYGPNRILETAQKGWLDLARDTLKDPMLWFLLGTSALFAFVGQVREAAIMLVAVLPLVGMDAYLHRRTRASTEGLSSRLAQSATVVREGAARVVPAMELVPGDLVIVATGEAFPADGLLVGGERMQVDESALTGESLPARKLALDRLPRDEAEAGVAGASWGLAGTRLLSGEARMRVAYIGGETLYGEIARSAHPDARTRTPLQIAVGQLVVVLIVGAVLLCLTLAWVRWQQGHGLVDALLTALTLAVAALPEEFPVVLTFFLGVGVYRLAKRQALVRRAVVVENIGRVTCICSDKTGTITEGRLRLSHRDAAEAVAPEFLLQLAAAASRRETGDPMDVAILDALPRALPWETVATYPFTEDRKRETGVLREDGRLIAAVKGAPEVVFGQCGLEPAALREWMARVDAFADTGHKVIACAWRELDGVEDWAGGEPERGFRVAGLLCFEDPIRPGVVEALQTCRAAGIRVVMVTGDHARTALAVAREIGLGGGAPRVVDGAEMSARLERGDTSPLRDADVIARAVPAQKLDLVRAFRDGGEIVAVTGDGVNDVPALQAADIGIAMGERGTRSAREVAAIVLLDDNFRSIVRAIAEGRQLFTNLQLSFQYLLMIHLPLVLTAALIPLAGFPVLYLPIHVVWLELIIHPTALLVFQELPAGTRLRPLKRTARLRFFGGAEWAAIVSVSALLTVAVGFSFLRGLEHGYDVDHARAIALAALTSASASITAGLTQLRTRPARAMVAATLALSFLLVQTPWLASLLNLKPLDPDDWALALGGGAAAGILAASPWWWRRLMAGKRPRA